jgi:hypothetical protein
LRLFIARVIKPLSCRYFVHLSNKSIAVYASIFLQLILEPFKILLYMNMGIAFIIPFLLRGILLSMYAMNYCKIPKRSMRATIKIINCKSIG